LLVTIAWSFTPGHARESVTSGDVRVDVSKRAADLEGFSTFHVVAVNSGQKPRSVHGQIQFLRASSTTGGTPRAVGKCTVYLELPPGQSTSRTFRCRDTNSSQYRFTVKAVYDFILDG
jgi:hypothetical protein